MIDTANEEPDSFTVLAHPNWHSNYDHLPQERMEALTGYVGVELYNGVIERLPGAALAVDRWDQLLSKGRRAWGFANDDSHADGDVELGWNVVQSAERTADAIVDGLTCQPHLDHHRSIDAVDRAGWVLRALRAHRGARPVRQLGLDSAVLSAMRIR